MGGGGVHVVCSCGSLVPMHPLVVDRVYAYNSAAAWNVIFFKPKKTLQCLPTYFQFGHFLCHGDHAMTI